MDVRTLLERLPDSMTFPGWSIRSAAHPYRERQRTDQLHRFMGGLAGCQVPGTVPRWRENDASCRIMQVTDGSKEYSREACRRSMVSWLPDKEEQILAMLAGTNPTEAEATLRPASCINEA